MPCGVAESMGLSTKSDDRYNPGPYHLKSYKFQPPFIVLDDILNESTLLFDNKDL